MAGLHFFKFDLDAWARATEQLSKSHQAYYALLLIFLYRRERPRLPAAQARKATGLRGRAWTSFADALAEEGCIVLEDGGETIYQPRVEAELEAFQALAATRAAAGRSGGQATAAGPENGCGAAAEIDPQTDLETVWNGFGNDLETPDDRFGNGLETPGDPHAAPEKPNENSADPKQLLSNLAERAHAPSREPEPELRKQRCARELIQALDAAIVATFGAAQARPWPDPGDLGVALDLVDAGATAAMVSAEAGGICRRLVGKGAAPPRLAYVAPAVRAAIETKRPAAAVPARPTTMREHCYLWAIGRDWPDDLGPPPDAAGCRASAADLAAAAGCSKADRDRDRIASLQARLRGDVVVFGKFKREA